MIFHVFQAGPGAAAAASRTRRRPNPAASAARSRRAVAKTLRLQRAARCVIGDSCPERPVVAFEEDGVEANLAQEREALAQLLGSQVRVDGPRRAGAELEGDLS